jgi:3-dehydroshikimate dehydratase
MNSSRRENRSESFQSDSMAAARRPVARIGLVSVTFRTLTPRRIIDAAIAANLTGIEWGGDVHVPHGDLDTARRVRAQTEASGLSIASYGSYYKVGSPMELPFESVLHTAVELGAPGIRVWAGTSGSSTCPPAERSVIVEDLARITEMSRSVGIGISLEFHQGTLTDTAGSAVKLMREVVPMAPALYWQPGPSRDEAENLEDLAAIAPYLSNLHVFHWAGTERRPLEEGSVEWTRYLRCALKGGFNGWMLLEFVRGDRVDQLVLDAVALRSISGEAGFHG